MLEATIVVILVIAIVVAIVLLAQKDAVEIRKVDDTTARRVLSTRENGGIYLITGRYGKAARQFAFVFQPTATGNTWAEKWLEQYKPYRLKAIWLHPGKPKISHTLRKLVSKQFGWKPKGTTRFKPPLDSRVREHVLEALR